MALINFYQQDNIWTVGDKVGLSSGQYFKKTDTSGKISVCHELNAIFGHDNGIVAVGLPTEFCDASGDAYTDLAAFKTATDDFFFNVAAEGGGGGSVASGYTPWVVPLVQVDGRLVFIAPDEVDLTKDTIVIEGKFTHTPSIDYTVTNAEGKGNFTFVVAPTEQLVIRYIKK